MLKTHRISHTRRLAGLALAALIAAPIAALSGSIAADSNESAFASRIDSEPMPVVRVTPAYPATAAQERIEGHVRLEFLIATDGSVEDIVLIESVPEGVFDRSAMDAFSQWRFQPAMVDGSPIPQRATQTLEFRLD